MDVTYCSRLSCSRKSCGYHQINVPDGRVVSMSDRSFGVGCYRSEEDYLELKRAICKGTQKTNYKCSDTCKALCSVNGDCAYCSIIAEEISKEVYVDGE